jgi:hypothetical protein
MFSTFFPEKITVFEIISKYLVGPDKSCNTAQNKRGLYVG